MLDESRPSEFQRDVVNFGLLLLIYLSITVCCRFFQLKQKIPKGLSIFLSKVVMGDLESVEKIIPQQRPLGVSG